MKTKDGQEKSEALHTELENLHLTLSKTEEELDKVKGSEASLMSSVEGLQEVSSHLHACICQPQSGPNFMKLLSTHIY